MVTGALAVRLAGGKNRCWENALALYVSLGVPEADEVRALLAVI